MSREMLRITAMSLALLAAGPVLAQTATEEPTETVTEGDATTTVTGDTEDGGFDLGWLGLLGLLGLAGLRGRQRDTPHVHTTTTPRV